ncbi:hypothetical protein DRE_00075 [Drechslerella stenobrocha 248]|uniref:Uncharacterized protein n=1 Tax=Drechslerella stenobrocha 248 TaxID=1043628 RepID=W7IHN2_9PEZI|nr:hypothetical protein DRE_00075 [Drechslerella stenobrocha 248]
MSDRRASYPGRDSKDIQQTLNRPRRQTDSDPDSSSDSDSDSSTTESSNSTLRHRNNRMRNQQQYPRSSSADRQHASDRFGGLTKVQTAPVRRTKARPASDSENRRRHQPRGYYHGDSDSSSTDSDSDSSDSPSSSPSKGAKSTTGASSSSYNKRPKTRLEKRVDAILNTFGLLHMKNEPSKRQLASPDPEKYAQQKQALQAAVTAAAIEAWRSHSKPGGLNLEKIIRVIVAGIAAGGMDILVDSKPGHNTLRDIAEAVVGGLATSKSLGGKITHRREGGTRGQMIDGFIAFAASKMVKPPKQDELDRRKKEFAKRPRSVEPPRRPAGSSSRRHQR